MANKTTIAGTIVYDNDLTLGIRRGVSQGTKTHTRGTYTYTTLSVLFDGETKPVELYEATGLVASLTEAKRRFAKKVASARRKADADIAKIRKLLDRPIQYKTAVDQIAEKVRQDFG